MEPNVQGPKWKRIRKLGQGTFGSVYEVQNLDTKNIYAIKIANSKAKNGNRILSEEIRIHSKLIHPNIIQFVTSFNIEESHSMVIEIANGGDLSKQIKLGLSKEKIRKWGTEITRSLIYLKEHGILHRDIKGNNVLIKDNVAKLSDFGRAIFVTELAGSTKIVGTSGYIAPEVVRDRKYSYQSDVWSFGVYMWEVTHRQEPFKGHEVFEIAMGTCSSSILARLNSANGLF